MREEGFLPRAAAERLPKELAIGNLVTFDIAEHRTLVSTHARIRRCHDDCVERGFKLLEHVCIVQQRDITGVEVDHIVFGKCFREWKRQRVKAEGSSTGQRGARPIQYGSRRSTAYIRPPRVKPTKLVSQQHSSDSGAGRPTRCCVPQHTGLNRIVRLGWRMPPPSDKGKCRVTIHPITIYHRPQFGHDRIAAALPAAAAVATSPCIQSEFCPLPSDSAGT